MKSNVIPRKFYNIKVKMLIDTSESKTGDIINIGKNDFGYIGHNKRTNRHFYIFAAMLRNSEICEFLEVTQ